MAQWTKKELLSNPIKHIDITGFDARPVVDAYRKMAYTSRTLANAADIYSMMLKDKECAVILTLAGSLISAGLKKAIVTMLVWLPEVASVPRAIDAVLAGKPVASEQRPSLGCNIKWKPGNEPAYFSP